MRSQSRRHSPWWWGYNHTVHLQPLPRGVVILLRPYLVDGGQVKVLLSWRRARPSGGGGGGGGGTVHYVEAQSSPRVPLRSRAIAVVVVLVIACFAFYFFDFTSTRLRAYRARPSCSFSSSRVIDVFNTVITENAHPEADGLCSCYLSGNTLVVHTDGGKFTFLHMKRIFACPQFSMESIIRTIIIPLTVLSCYRA